MRSGLVISKRRMLDWCIAKGNDTRTYIDNTDPENPVTVYPVFRFRQTDIAGVINNPVGILDIRSSIKQSDTVLNNVVQRFSGAIASYIGDNQQRNAYPAGMLELHIRTPRWQRNMLQALNFRYGGFGNGNNNQCLISELDIEPLGNVLGIKTADTNDINGRLTNLNLKNNKDLKRIEIYAISEDTLDISDNINLEFLLVGNDFGAVDTLLLANEYPLLTHFNMGNNNLTDISGLNAPNLTSLSVFDNTTLGNIDISVFPNLLTLSANNTGMTALDVSDNVNLETLYLGGTGNQVNNNNLVNNIVGNELLSNLKILSVRSAKNTKPFELDDHPLLETLYARQTSDYTAFELGVNLNLNLKTIITQFTPQPIPYNFNTYPNLEDLRSYGGSFSLINTASSTNLKNIHWVNTTSEDLGVIDLSNNLSLNNIGRITGSGFTKIKLPDINMTRVWVQSSPNLTEIQNLNIPKNRNALWVYNTQLQELSIDNISNLTSLIIGGGSETFNTVGGLGSKLPTMVLLNIQPTPLIYSFELGTDLPMCRCLVLKGDYLNVSYNTRKTWLSNIQMVRIYPSSSSGLATDGDQVANLIIDLSATSWNLSSQDIATPDNVGGTIDLRGNCTSPAPSTALTDALDLLNTKGVTVLTN